MKNINLLSPENSPGGKPSDEQSEILHENEIISGKKKSKQDFSHSFGLAILLFLVFLLAWIFYQKLFFEKQQVPTTSETPSILPKKYKEVTPEKPVKHTKQVATEATAPKATPKPLPAKKAKPRPKLKAKPKLKSVASKPAIPVEKREYWLLVGTFSSQKETTAKLNKIKSLGFNPYQKSIRSKQKVYMVYGGGETDYQSAKKLQKQLQAQEFDTYLPSSTNQKYRVRAGVFANQDYAKKLLRKLKAKGYKAAMEPTKMPLNKYEIRLGDFQTYQAAKAQQNALRTKGIKTVLLLKPDNK